jgi:hypothetical protein
VQKGKRPSKFPGSAWVGPRTNEGQHADDADPAPVVDRDRRAIGARDEQAAFEHDVDALGIGAGARHLLAGLERSQLRVFREKQCAVVVEAFQDAERADGEQPFADAERYRRGNPEIVAHGGFPATLSSRRSARSTSEPAPRPRDVS